MNTLSVSESIDLVFPVTFDADGKENLPSVETLKARMESLGLSGSGTRLEMRERFEKFAHEVKLFSNVLVQWQNDPSSMPYIAPGIPGRPKGSKNPTKVIIPFLNTDTGVWEQKLVTQDEANDYFAQLNSK